MLSHDIWSVSLTLKHKVKISRDQKYSMGSLVFHHSICIQTKPNYDSLISHKNSQMFSQKFFAQTVKLLSKKQTAVISHRTSLWMNLSKKEITQLLDNIIAVLEHCNVFIYLTSKYLTAYKVIIIIIKKKHWLQMFFTQT